MSHNTEHQPKTSIETPSTHETRSAVYPDSKESKMGRKGQMLVAGTILAGVAIAGVGGAKWAESNSNEVPEYGGEPTIEAPVTSAPVEQEPTAEPSTEVGQDDPTNIPEEEPPVESSAIERLETMSFEEFDVLNRQEQLIFVADRLDEINGYVGYGEELENYNPVDIADINNNGNEIIQQWLYAKKAALLQVDMTDLVSLDKSAAKKMLTGPYYYTNDQVTESYSRSFETIDAAGNMIDLTDEYTATSTSELQTGVDRDGNPIQYRDISYFSSNGWAYDGRFVFTEFTNQKGERQGIWQVQQMVNDGDEFIENF